MKKNHLLTGILLYVMLCLVAGCAQKISAERLAPTGSAPDLWITSGEGVLPFAGQTAEEQGVKKERDTYINSEMDFGSIATVAVLPFANLTSEEQAAGRVRDAFTSALLATEAFYVLPHGETARILSRAGIRDATTPSSDEIKKFGGPNGIDAVITGVLREYGTVRAGNTAANVISLSLQMSETQTGTVVWSAATTKGGISLWDRLFGGGGEPMNDVTETAAYDLIDQLFQ
jgi:TolB-like protein